VQEITYRRLYYRDYPAFLELRENVEKTLPTSEFLLPLAEEYFRFIRFGAFNCQGGLIGAVLLETCQYYMQPHKEILTATDKKVCALSSMIVHPNYRSRGVITSLNILALNTAQEYQFELATCLVHPCNILGLSAVQKLEFREVAEIMTNLEKPVKIFTKKLIENFDNKIDIKTTTCYNFMYENSQNKSQPVQVIR